MCLSINGCATIPAKPAVTPPRISAEALAAGLIEADRIATRGCYLCLKEAAAAYDRLVQLSNDRVLAAKAFENYFMIALREIELRMPDSGARDAARALESAPSAYASYLSVLDTLSVAPKKSALTHEARKQLAADLEKEWPASPMKAYFYIAAALNAGLAEILKPQLDGIVAAHPSDLSLRYLLQTFRPMFSRDASLALIGQEPGFGEVHLLLGTRAVLTGQMADAHRELTRAIQLLPDSASIASALATVNISFARYAEALNLYEQVLAVSPDDAARLGKAKALSYLARHEEAIVMLDELLKDARNSPGEKYYWRAWNRLRLDHTQAAYDDAMAALNVMRNDEVYRLAGIASLRMDRAREARTYFEGALHMNASDCDSLGYLGQIDALEKNLRPALARFTGAVACYDEQLSQLKVDLARYEKDITGLSNGLIAGLRARIAETEVLRGASMKHAVSLASPR